MEPTVPCEEACDGDAEVTGDLTRGGSSCGIPVGGEDPEVLIGAGWGDVIVGVGGDLPASGDDGVPGVDELVSGASGVPGASEVCACSASGW